MLKKKIENFINIIDLHLTLLALEISVIYYLLFKFYII